MIVSGNPWFDSSVLGILGLLIGSFLNVVIHRLPIMMERDWAAQCAELRGEDAAVAAVVARVGELVPVTDLGTGEKGVA